MLNCVGLRAEESPGRANHVPFEAGARGTEAEVWSACRASGAPIHPAYAAGLPRASCAFCIYAPRAALVVAGRLHPELLAEYVSLEREIGHDFKHRLPIAQVADDIAAGAQPDGPIESWCM